MHAMYEQQQDVDPRSISSAQSVQQVSSQGRAYAIVLRDHGESGTVVEGIFLVNSFPAKILFDSGASHSFISLFFMLRLQLISDFLDTPLSMAYF